jgi:hypothetical protein
LFWRALGIAFGVTLGVGLGIFVLLFTMGILASACER